LKGGKERDGTGGGTRKLESLDGRSVRRCPHWKRREKQKQIAPIWKGTESDGGYLRREEG